MSHGIYFMVMLLTSILGDVRSEVLSGGSKSLMSKPRKPCKVPSSKEYYYMSMEGVRLEPNENIDGCGEVAAQVKCFNPTRVLKPVDFAVCFDEQWYPSHHTCEQKKCKPVHDSYSTVYSCTTPKGVKVSCGSRAVPGTKVTIRCAHQRYRFSKSLDMVHKKLCLESGKWEKMEDICEPQCGLVFNNATHNNSSLKVLNEFPWHVVIYGYKNNKWNQLCVGTLLTNLVVLTAYKCLENWDNVKTLEVAVGKYYKDYNGTDSTSSRKYEVNRVYWRENEIILLGTGEYIEFSDTVGSVCWASENHKHKQLTNKVTNTVATRAVVWGKDEKGFTAKVVKTILCNQNCTLTNKKLSNRFCCEPNKFVPEDMGSGIVNELNGDGVFYLVGIFSGEYVEHGDEQIPVFIDVMDGHLDNFITSSIQKNMMEKKLSALEKKG